MIPPSPRPAAPARYPIAIIGAGALGLSFAARLATTTRVAVVARTAEAAAALRVGIRVGDQPFRADAFCTADAPQADWVIVLVKTGDTAAAARTAAAMAPHGVVSLQNGLTEDTLRTDCPVALVGQGITTAGAHRDATGVTLAGAGEILLPPGFEALAGLLQHAGFAARIEADIHAARLAKLLVNVAINPLAALHRVRNGALLEAPYRAQLDQLVREAWPVLRAEGLKLDKDAALARVHAVALATGANRASMLQDIEAGRPTEIDAITGALLAMAARHAIAVPAHTALYRQLSPARSCG